MKHIMFADKSLLVGDELADLLMEYAVKLANERRADSVDLNALGVEGNDVTATFLLDPGTIMVAETANTAMPEPDNSVAIAYIKDKLAGTSSNTKAELFSAEDLRHIDRTLME